ncbi:related to metalloproteinase [Cephalotrichum gorgonifer]|uniref:Related to metalloproteinase n=1 Tax=Cephalotrichum gorgonifer TaxID=2041049 RepID=A0AAE8MR61_9PEZI|nr:related to metalloproteinase [Cephalotrichum gorgonifer]
MASNQHDSQASTDYKEAFSLFDKRGTGRVTLESLGDLLRACGQNPTLSEIRDLEKSVGGEFDFETFQRILNRPGGFREPGEPDEYCRGFQVFDKDMTGFIGVGQVKYILTNLGEKMTEEEVDELLKAVDTSSGQVNYTAAVNLASPIKLRHPFFLLSIFLFLGITVILAAPRALPRLNSIFGQLRQRPRPITTTQSVFFKSQRPLYNATMAPDKHKSPPQPPPLFTGTAESIVADSKALCDTTRSVLDKVVASETADKGTFSSVMLPQLEDENEANLSARILGFYQYVSGNEALRSSSTEAEKIMDDFSIECNMREDVFKLVEGVYNRRASATDLDGESNRLLEKEYKGYIKNGLGLPVGEKRDRFKEIKKRLSQISIEFQKNLNEENGGIWFTPEQLEGVPKDVVDTFEKGEGENEGKLRLTFKYPDLVPTQKFAVNPETRREVFVQNENKIPENVAIFKETLELRDEAARLLGYPDHASLRIEDKMAKNEKTVNEFLGDLRTRLSPGGKTEIARLLELKKSDLEARGLPFDGSYYLWDNRFYDRLMIEKDYNIDENKIAEYFPLQSTVTGMLRIFEELLGFVFVELGPEERAKISPTGKAEDIAWHEDVILFSVWDDASEGDGFVGYLYLDLHPRKGKYGHAANFNLQPGFVKKDGSRRFPATALVCNFSKPSGTKPSLLKHDEVVTLFHELGHGIHDLAGRTRFARFHGTSTVRDFVEAPSQMLENWCWTPSVLKALSNQYETGEKIPDDLIEKLIATKHVNGALFNLRQLHFGIFDMTVHTPKSHEQLKEMDIPGLYNGLRAEICGLKGPEAFGEKSNWGNGQATFGHLMGGYDAGYYGYLFSDVYSADMFHTIFKKDPMNGVEGRRYRHAVLEKGGSQDEMVTLEGFLGRKPNTEAFYKELGISQ